MVYACNDLRELGCLHIFLLFVDVLSLGKFILKEAWLNFGIVKWNLIFDKVVKKEKNIWNH